MHKQIIWNSILIFLFLIASQYSLATVNPTQDQRQTRAELLFNKALDEIQASEFQAALDVLQQLSEWPQFLSRIAL